MVLNKDGERRPRMSNPRPGFAPDLDGKANITGQIVMGKEQYAVYSSPSEVGTKAESKKKSVSRVILIQILQFNTFC